MIQIALKKCTFEFIDAVYISSSFVISFKCLEFFRISRACNVFTGLFHEIFCSNSSPSTGFLIRKGNQVIIPS